MNKDEGGKDEKRIADTNRSSNFPGAETEMSLS
jgi:hypothetical protein